MSVTSIAMVGALTILYSDIGEGELEVIERVVHPPSNWVTEDVLVRQVSVAKLAGVLIPALDRGAVVLVAASGRLASLGLSLGADEVVRVGELSEATLRKVLERAIARAGGRAQRDAQLRARDATTFSLLAAALGNELGASLTIASTCCEVLSSGLPSMLNASDELLDWAVTAAPIQRVRRLVAVCSAGPSANELSQTADEAKASVARALALVHTLRELSFDGGQRHVVLDVMLVELADMLRAYVSSWADLELHTDGRTVAEISRSNFTWIMSTLLASSLEAIRASGKARGKIVVRTSEYDGCALVEVAHNGRATTPDLRPNAFDPAPPEDLVALREQARQVGGEFLVDSDGVTTTLRLILPSGEAQAAAERLPSGWDHFKSQHS